MINFVLLENLDHESPNNELDDDMLNFLSEKIGMEYKRLARNLDINDQEIEEIDNIRNLNLQDKCFRVFRKLKRDNGIVEWNQVKKALEAFYQIGVISDFYSEYPEFP